MESKKSLIALIIEAFAIRHQLYSGSDDSIETMSGRLPHSTLSPRAGECWRSPRRPTSHRAHPTRLLRLSKNLPHDWKEQRSFLGFAGLVLELIRCEWIDKRENCIALGPSGTGKTHVALGLGLAACQKGYSVAFATAAALVHELMEARDERRLRALQKHLNTVKLLIVDELGYVPFTAVGSELLFEVFSQRYERASTIVTTNPPFDEWTSIFGSERLTGALLDRLTHHVHILEMNGESYRLATSKKAQRRSAQERNQNLKSTNKGDPTTDR